MEPYSADRSLKGKLRRRLALLAHRRPVRMRLERPMITFSFDDAPATAVHAGAAVLEARGLKGTYYVSAGLAGGTGPMGAYATLDDTAALAGAGHELACHTFSHLDCGQAAGPAIAAEADRNAEALAAIGAPHLESFAYPYGDVSRPAKAVLGSRFRTLRTVQAGLVEDGSDANQLPSVGIEGPDGEAVAMGWLNKARAQRAWLILYTHDVSEAPSAWGCTPQALARLADAALAGGFEVVTAAEGARRLGL
ncbi:peptidoglycan/xylan/chitin deacetylase (PgdA/CDA1 family) [Caulobacter ginsengisoli]|uniref:Chitooligosaccharide deacetylase n=1 Tax=Caulobacter ginsengisoli TaxID=400775 RepID=A0ABU0ISW6_9CAUL|nr:polysaccharide deacetylase family protein [Caulobacter ginsengisoli]MDQ0464129.1 peptidoglycan/xylan/chitin deacetylase (PgdA/CDA1 family) [Caulobacter ginsengisoli]